MVKITLMVCLAVSTQYRRVTDGQTDRRTEIQWHEASRGLSATAELLVKLLFVIVLLSRRSRQRERLSASELSICSFVCLSPKSKKTRFSQKLSNLELWSLLTSYRKLCNWAFQRTHYWIPKIQDSWDLPSWKSTWRHFFLPRVVRFG